MTSSSGVQPAITTAPALPSNYLLIIGGWFSLAFAVFQVSAIWWPLAVLRYFGGPAELSVAKPVTYALLCLGVGIIVAVFGLYALSGAGKIRRLPVLRTVLIFTTSIYLLRGLLFIPQAIGMIKHPELLAARFLVFSLISLCVGLVHLGGVVRFYQMRPAS